ncbi:MAG: endonuclease [Bacteroidales bacterium]|nr:endonuclease [Bacteroidales bacterium]
MQSDSSVAYNQFDSDGDHHWNEYRYRKKLMMIYKTLVALEGNLPVAIIGLAEVENKKVLSDLISQTPLNQKNYKIIHFESPDRRGIDVALLYQVAQFNPLYAKRIPVVSPEAPTFRTRDILYVKGLLLNDTVHVFVNHWPSSYSGLMRNRPKRLLAAHTLKQTLDSIQSINPHANLLVMGDFNETPGGPAIKFLTRNAESLYNLDPKPDFGNAKGSIKRGSVWSVYDQMIVSKSLITDSTGLFVKDKSFHIFDVGFLLERDSKFSGVKAFRSYEGFKYHGGISDHLPVYIEISAVK